MILKCKIKVFMFFSYSELCFFVNMFANSPYNMAGKSKYRIPSLKEMEKPDDKV